MILTRLSRALFQVPRTLVRSGVQPFWSPNSRDIGFFGLGALRRVSAFGGAVQVLGEAEVAYGGAWSSTGTIIYAPEDVLGLMRVSADGGPVTPVTTLPKDGVWGAPVAVVSARRSAVPVHGESVESPVRREPCGDLSRRSRLA